MKRLSSNLYLDTVNGKEMLHCRCGAVLAPPMQIGSQKLTHE